MDREYALDILSYRFPIDEAYTWSRAMRGVRIRTGSTMRSEFSIVSDVKQSVVLRGPHEFTVDARFQEDGQAQRGFFELGYRYVFNSRHAAGIQHTFSRYKPDFDVTTYYRLRTEDWGRARFDLTLANAYNNFVYSTLGISAEDEDILRIYETPPIVAQFQASTPEQYPVRLEVYLGWRPGITATFTSQTNSAFQYQDTETAHYGSLLSSYSWSTGATGVFYRWDQSSLDRHGTRSGMSSDYETEQRVREYGAFAIEDWRNFRANLWYTYGRYTDKQSGTDFRLSTLDGPLNYWENRHEIQARLRYAPTHGPQYGLKYTAYLMSLDKEASNSLTRQWTDEWRSLGTRNYRLTPLLGFQWPGGSVIAGVGIDLDMDNLPPGIPDSPGWFDNGYGRLTLYW